MHKYESIRAKDEDPSQLLLSEAKRQTIKTATETNTEILRMRVRSAEMFR